MPLLCPPVPPIVMPHHEQARQAELEALKEEASALQTELKSAQDNLADTVVRSKTEEHKMQQA